MVCVLKELAINDTVTKEFASSQFKAMIMCSAILMLFRYFLVKMTTTYIIILVFKSQTDNHQIAEKGV